jgi:signal transduction histidine kinase
MPLGSTPNGLLALLLADGAPFVDEDLRALAAGVAQALGHVRGVHELSRAAERQDREHDQLLRAERMRALGDMALGIAHDFNNVLNAILAQTGAVMALVGDVPAAAAALERLRQAGLDGAATIRRIQEFSGQRRDREFEPVDIADVVERVAERLRERAPAGVRVDVVISARPPALGNAAELEELLNALIDNALEAVDESGTVTLELSCSGDQFTLLVGDSGPGMTPSVRQRAFDPFFTTKPRNKGLGLSMAWGITRRHGGLLEVDSRAGVGTRVRVRLPVVDPEVIAAEAATTAEESGPSAANSTRRVLLVEDDPDNREAMCSLLTLSGFDVTAADCGAAGVRAFSAGRYDMVLTDLGLPDMDGWQVATEIKQWAPAVPIALITGWGLNLDRDEIRRRGVDLLVKKPLDPKLFLRQIENLLQLGGRKPSA